MDVRLPPAYTDEGLRAALDGPPPGARAAHPHPVHARRAAVRPGTAGRPGGRGRLPAQGPGVHRRAVHRRDAHGGPRRHGDGPRGRREAAGPALQPAAGDPAQPAGNARSSRCWPRAGPTARSRSAWSSRRRRSASTAPASSASSTCRRPTTTTAACWPCSPTWTADQRDAPNPAQLPVTAMLTSDDGRIQWPGSGMRRRLPGQDKGDEAGVTGRRTAPSAARGPDGGGGTA